MKKTTLFVLLFIAGLAAIHAAQSRETLTLSAADLKTLRIDCGAGYLKVQGIDGLERIEVSAVLDVRGFAEEELAAFKKEFVTLKLEKIAGQAELTATIESGFSLAALFGGSHDARIDLDIRVPRRLALAIDDGSGDLDIRDSDGNLSLDDGSGDIRLDNIKGQVEIEDGSGDIELNDAGSDVDIDDGSGQINLNRVLGAVIVDDGSGDIVIDGVEKDVTIDEAGSGSVEIRNVKGSVKK
jgi:DUF4097 and DUF4098 domain-containing protein YvlB